MKQIANISINEFFLKSDVTEFEMLIKYIKPKNNFLGKTAKMSELTLSEVARLRVLVPTPTIENFIEIYNIVYKVSAKEFLAGKVLEFFESNRYIGKYINDINEREVKLLSRNVSEENQLKWKMAGGDRLNAFREIGIMISMGKEFGYSPEEVGNWKYETCFAIMLHNNILDDINKNLAEMQS
jgi:hypothetical protein